MSRMPPPSARSRARRRLLGRPARRGVEDSPEHRAFLEQERELRAAASRRRPAPAVPIALPYEPTRRSPSSAAVAGIDELVTAALLGEGRHPAEFPTGVQELHGRVLRLARMLTDRGWEVDADAARAVGDVVLTDAAGTGRIAFAPPAALPADAVWRTGADGAELADDVTVHDYIGRVETSARLATVQESAAPTEDGSSLLRAERRAE